MDIAQTDAQIAQLEALNGAVIRHKRAAVKAMEERNHLAYLMHGEGVSLGQLAMSMGLTRSGVQGLLKAHAADCPICPDEPEPASGGE